MFHFMCPAMLDMSRKVVIVTGGTQGIGRGIAQRFLDAGAEVVVCGRNAPPSLPASPSSRTSKAREAMFVAADVKDVEAIDRVVTAAVEKYGRLDVLVN